jgi:hypothetical protein
MPHLSQVMLLNFVAVSRSISPARREVAPVEVRM